MSDFKVGDEIRVKDDCSKKCYLRKSHKGVIGYITYIEGDDVFVQLPGHSDGIWIHFPSCIERIYKGFDPSEIISKSFGVTNGI